MNRICMFTLLLIGCNGGDDAKTMDTADAQTEPGDSDDTGETGDTNEQDDTGEDTDTDPPTPPQDVSVFMLEVSTTDADWRDLAFLATIPASTHINDGRPAVLAVENIETPQVPTVDLLERLSPDHAYVMGTETSVDQAETTTGLDADGAEHWSLVLAETFWETSEYVVVVSADDYPAATLGASLAAQLRAPMLVAESDTEAIAETISALGAETLVLGLDVDPPSWAVGHTRLDGLEDVLSWLVTHDIDVSYLTVSNTNDRLSGRSQKASLLAPMYAANRGGLSLPITLDMPTLVVDDGGDHPVIPFLVDVYDQLGSPPVHLAIVGAHDALPQMRKPTIFDNPLEEQPVSDLPYGEIDDDVFVDIAIGRIIGDTVEELATIATRTAQYEQLQDGTWEQNFIESGLWGFDELRDITLNVGFDPPQHLSQTEINAESSLEVGVFLHKDHSYCQILGNAFDTYSNTLFAPAVVVSRGCSVGGMDLLDDTQRSIVDHMFGQGIVAFVGAARNAIAYNTIIEVSLWNQLLNGHTLGESFKYGVNDAIVHWLDDGSSAMRYAIDTEIVYGDPAFQMYIPGPHQTEPAMHSFDGTTARVSAPEEWTLVPYHPDMLAEWGYEGELYMYAAPGVSPRTYWAGSYDNEDMYFGVQLPLEEAPMSVTETGDYPSPLGWGGQAHIDEHADGSVSALWRVRLLDYNQLTGEITAEQSEFVYEVE